MCYHCHLTSLPSFLKTNLKIHNTAFISPSFLVVLFNLQINDLQRLLALNT